MVEFITKEGYEGYSDDPKIALIQWYIAQPCEKDKEIHQFETDENKFICQIISAIERGYGKILEIDKIITFKIKCYAILIFLRLYGNIEKLKILEGVY